jgi:mono/diheme cytochrome c family protein
MQKISLAAVAALFSIILCSCGGSDNQDKSSASAPMAKSEPASGEAIYKKTCIACHQADGVGIPSVYPPLAKSDYIADKEKTIMQVLKGSSGEIVVNGNKFNNTMPPQQLNDDEIAAVLTYVYGSFGNSGSAVTPGDVKALRGKI